MAYTTTIMPMVTSFSSRAAQTHIKHEQGFTVIEILIGIGLFAVVMPAIILSVVGVARLNDRAADLTRANMIAERKIESLRSAGFNTMTDGVTDFTTELDPSFTEPRQAEYTITTPSPGVKEIEVDIEYTANGSLENLTFRSIITELGIAQ